MMSTIKVVLEADQDGTLHLPVPPELRKGKIEVTATLKSSGVSGEPPARPRFGCLAGKIAMAGDFDEPLEDFKGYTE